MTKLIVDALQAKYVAQKLQAVANLQNYLANSAGIGEHPDIVSECDELLEQISQADGKLQTLSNVFQPSSNDTESDPVT